MSTVAEKSELKIINHGALGDQFGDDLEILKDIAFQFIERIDGYVEEISNAIKENNAEIVERSAHNLKGASSNFFAERVIDGSSQLESLGREGNLERCPQVFERLKLDVKSFKEELEKLC